MKDRSFFKPEDFKQIVPITELIEKSSNHYWVTYLEPVKKIRKEKLLASKTHYQEELDIDVLEAHANIGLKNI